MNTIIIYHSADADGWMSKAVLENEIPKKLPSSGNIRSIGWDFGQPPVEISQEELAESRLIVVDLPPNPFDELITFAKEFLWIDHHKSAIESNAQIQYPGIQNTSLSACRLAWAFFNLPPTDLTKYETEPMPDEPQLVFLIGLRDVWKHKGTRYEAICSHINLALIADRSFSFLESLQVSSEAHWLCVDDLVEEGVILDRFSKSLNQEAADRGAFLKTLWGIKFLVINSQLRGSQLLEHAAFELQRSGESVEALCVFSLNKFGKFNFSLYHAHGQKHRDLTVIAKKYGGGGHAGACGFEVGWDVVLSLFK